MYSQKFMDCWKKCMLGHTGYSYPYLKGFFPVLVLTNQKNWAFEIGLGILVQIGKMQNDPLYTDEIDWSCINQKLAW